MSTIVGVKNNKGPKIIAVAADLISTDVEEGSQEVFQKLCIDPNKDFLVGYVGYLTSDFKERFHHRLIGYEGKKIDLRKRLKSNFFPEFKNINDKISESEDGSRNIETHKCYAVFVTRFNNQLDAVLVAPTGRMERQFPKGGKKFFTLGNKNSKPAANNYLEAEIGFNDLNPVEISVNDAILYSMMALEHAQYVDEDTKGRDLAIVRENDIFDEGEYLRECMVFARNFALEQIGKSHQRRKINYSRPDLGEILKEKTL